MSYFVLATVALVVALVLSKNDELARSAAPLQIASVEERALLCAAKALEHPRAGELLEAGLNFCRAGKPTQLTVDPGYTA